MRLERLFLNKITKHTEKENGFSTLTIIVIIDLLLVIIFVGA